MRRAGQTPHGARPNREEVRGFGRGRVPARCAKPSGRSLEPRSNARPRGMAVLAEQSGRQNSAYRSSCFRLISALAKKNRAQDDSRPAAVAVSVSAHSNVRYRIERIAILVQHVRVSPAAARTQSKLRAASTIARFSFFVDTSTSRRLFVFAFWGSGCWRT